MRLERLRPWKIALALRMWLLMLSVKLSLMRHPLPRVVDDLIRPPARPRSPRMEPRQLSKINERVFRIGWYRPRCLTRSLVHLRLLRLQGDPAVLVIGLPRGRKTTDAHAWVELDGVVVGPPPGRAGHHEFVRYPRPSVRAEAP